MLLQQRRLHHQRHVARQPARLRFVGGAVDARGQTRGQAVEGGIGAARGLQFVHQRVGHRPVRSARSRSSAMMLPAPSQIELSGISR